MGSRVVGLGILSLTWFLHAAVVWISALGGHPLRSRGFALLVFGCGVLLSAGVALAVRRAAIPGRPGVQPPLPLAIERALRALVVGAASVSAITIAFAVLLPVVAYDALMYRMPVIAQWLDAGRIAWVASDDPVRNGYPLGQEAVSALIAAASGSFRFADVTSFAYVASGALALLELSSRCGARPTIARAAAALFVLAPMTILNVGTGYVDAAFAGATVAFLCYAALLTSERPAPGSAVATGMAAANVLALKGTGLGFVMVVALALVVRAWVGVVGDRRARMRSLALAALLALPGAFFVLRDVAHTGNPLWPVEVELFGHRVLRGVGPMEQILDVKSNTPAELVTMPRALRVLHTWFQLHGPADVFDDRKAGLGWAFVAFALPAFVALMWRARARRDVPREAIFLVLTTLACFALQPMAWWARYTLWLWGAGALALALEAERWANRAGFARLGIAGAALCALTLGEAGFALAHADGGLLALERFWSRSPRDPAAFDDVRGALNAQYWPPPSFFALGLERERDVCRGSWKADTDDGILDGVFAQFSPRPRLHVLADDDGDWPRVRAAWHAAGCSRLLLLRGSSVLPAAAADPSVVIERARAFDPLFVVHVSELARGDAVR